MSDLNQQLIAFVDDLYQDKVYQAEFAEYFAVENNIELTKEEIADAVDAIKHLPVFDTGTVGRELVRDYLLLRRGEAPDALEYPIQELLREQFEAEVDSAKTLLKDAIRHTEGTDRLLDQVDQAFDRGSDVYSRTQHNSETNAALAQQLLYNVECLDLTEEDQADLLDRVVRRETQAIAADLSEAGALAQLEFVLSQSEYDVAIALEKVMTGYWGRKRARRTRVGAFEVVSSELIIVDPVQPPLGEPNVLTAVRQGQWTGGLYQCNEKGIGIVNAALIAYHEDAKFFALNDATWVAEAAKVSATSGLVGIFDRARPEEWETGQWNQVAESETHVAIADSGIATGDVTEGEYIVHTARDEDERVIGVGLVFARFAEELTIAKVVKHFRGIENRDYPGRLLHALKSKQLNQAQIDELLNRSVRSLALSQVDSVLEADSLEKAEYLVGGLDFATALSELVSQVESTVEDTDTVEQLTIA